MTNACWRYNIQMRYAIGLFNFPKGNQQNTGTIIGQTKTGFAKIQTNNNNIVRRLPFNLIKLK